MLLLAFLQCYHTVHDLHWAYDPDFDRDIAFARGLLEGHYGQDPNYQGAWLWYNPLLFTTEAVIHKLTNLPLNVIAAQAGIYLKSPWTHLLLPHGEKAFRLQDRPWPQSFSFSSSTPATSAAGAPLLTHPGCSPFASPSSFFTSALSSVTRPIPPKNMAGSSHWAPASAPAFLSHTAPSLLLILLMAILTSRNLIAALKQKDRSRRQKVRPSRDRGRTYIHHRRLPLALLRRREIPPAYDQPGNLRIHGGYVLHRQLYGRW